MRVKKQGLYIGVIVVILVVWMLKDTFTQSGIKDLKGGFTEISTYRNENNTGPVQRIYAVQLIDTTVAQLIEYGNLMPHNKYGNTKVYFFLPNGNVPKILIPGDVNFEEQFNQYCFALYEKSAMGNFGLVKHPFKEIIKGQ